MTVFPHKSFSSTSCPGQIYGSQKTAYIERAQRWYDRMGGKATDGASTTADASVSTSGSSYTVKVTADALNVRKGPGTGYAKTGCIRDKGTYTIVEEREGRLGPPEERPRVDLAGLHEAHRRRGFFQEEHR